MSQVYASLEQLVALQFQGKTVSLTTKHPVTSLLSGKYASRLRGRGLTFDELREYRSGDDIRAIDWKATARLRKPHVRVYQEERERPVLLVVDQRVSMFFGSARTTKATAAAEAAALSAWRSLDAGNRIGGIVFSDEGVEEIRPHRSRRNVLRLCHALVEANRKLSVSTISNRAATLNQSLVRANNVARHDHLVIIITDFTDADRETRTLTTALAAKNDVLAVLVYDPLGANISSPGNLIATEGKQKIRIPASRDFADRFQSAFTATCEELKENLQGIRVPILPICTHDSVVEQITAALGGKR